MREAVGVASVSMTSQVINITTVVIGQMMKPVGVASVSMTSQVIGDWSDEGSSGCGFSKYDVTGDKYNNCSDWSDEGTSCCDFSKYDVIGDKYINCGDWLDEVSPP